jgi:hypothetical protein
MTCEIANRIGLPSPDQSIPLGKEVESDVQTFVAYATKVCRSEIAT